MAAIDRANKQLKRSMPNSENGSKPNKKTGFWNSGLKSSMEDPDLQVYVDDKIVVIKDKYPKAKFHYLVLPKENIPNLKKLNKNNVSLLKYMQEKGEEIAMKYGEKSTFRYGYHAVPSMSHLHLHVISQDFNSSSLKTKKHWNSFTTRYFLDSSKIINELEKYDKIDLMLAADAKSMLDSTLKCHVCKIECKNMPSLKTHIKTHEK